MSDRFLTRWPQAEVAPDGTRLCRWCCTPVKPPRRSWCDQRCIDEYLIRSSSGAARRAVFERDKGVCALCGLDCLLMQRWRHAIRQFQGYAGWADVRQRLGLSVHEWSQSLWQADHVVPVVKGGGRCGLDNYRTLCVWCHKKETRKLMEDLKGRRAERRSQIRRLRAKGVELRRKARAVVLFSGGVDSAVALAWALEQGWSCYPLFFDYGQSNIAEGTAAVQQIESFFRPTMGLRESLKVCRIPGYAELVPQCAMLNGGQGDFSNTRDVTVPNRTTVFLGLAAAYAYGVGAKHIVIGMQFGVEPSNTSTGPGFPENCEAAVRDHECVLTWYGPAPVRVHAPLLDFSKERVVDKAREYGLPLEKTVSCLRGSPACGTCISCAALSRCRRTS